MREKYWLSFILILILLFTTACGKTDLTQECPTTEPVLLTNATDNSSGENSLNIKQFIPLAFDESELSTETVLERQIYHDSYGSKLYSLISYYTERSELPLVWLHVFDMNTQETQKTQLKLDIQELEVYRIVSADIINEEKLSLKIHGNTHGQEADIYLTETDMSGNCLTSLTPYPKATDYPWNPSIESNRCVFDNPNGYCIIKEWDNSAMVSTLYSYNIESGARTPLTIFASENILTLCTGDSNTIYYLGNGYLNQYNLKKQTLIPLCNLVEMGLSVTGTKQLLINEKGELALCDLGGKLPGVYILTDEEIKNDNEIRFANMSIFFMEYTKRMAATFSTQNQSCKIKIERESEQNFEDFRNRIIMELVSGKGPELMWVSEDDMYILAEKGVLMDLSEIIPKEIMDELIPGVIQAGTVDGTLVGITPEISFYTMITSNEIWNEDSWNLSDILTLVESREDWGPPFFHHLWRLNGYSLFFDLFARDCYHTPFMDIEQGISYFDQKEFKTALAICKKYGMEEGSEVNANELMQQLKNGESIGKMTYVYNGLQSFSSLMKDCGDDFHIVGYPSETGQGNYLSSEGYLVVNVNAEHVKEISEFIAYLLSYENQFTVDCACVRRDVIENCIGLSYDNQPMMLRSDTERIFTPLDLKPDGTTYLEEYLAFLDSCVAEPHFPTAISTILSEELPAYFNGDKSVDDTAEIIHRRVQLYFDENK